MREVSWFVVILPAAFASSSATRLAVDSRWFLAQASARTRIVGRLGFFSYTCFLAHLALEGLRFALAGEAFAAAMALGVKPIGHPQCSLLQHVVIAPRWRLFTLVSMLESSVCMVMTVQKLATCTGNCRFMTPRLTPTWEGPELRGKWRFYKYTGTRCGEKVNAGYEALRVGGGERWELMAEEGE